jgi:ABC-2 type transport system ATP-binding protein
MTSPAIRVQHITKAYGNFQAVNDVTFDVQRGEIFAVLGPNGAGKSTTMRMILDIIKPDSGSIQVLGAPINDATKNRIGYLPEERGLYKSVPVLEMMSYLGRLKGLAGREATARATALLKRIDLEAYAKKKVSELSKGMQQKVQFAVTILHEPDLIIIDEPFSGLDPVNRLVLKDLIFEFRDRGGTVVMSTHQMNQVEEMCDRLMMIHRGQLKLYGAVDEIRKQYALHALIVQGQGDWTQLAGVTRVENISNGREGTLLHMAEQVTADDVLVAIAQAKDIKIEKFELAIPSLDDIFIRVAGKEAIES